MTAHDVSLGEDGRHLLVAGAGPTRRPVPAELLWRRCPSAKARRRRLETPFAAAPADVRIVRVTPIGNYGVNIAFSDGHDRGIYPWALLAELSALATADDFIMAAG